MSGHSELPPSSSDKWMNCLAWRRLNAGIEDTSSEAAEEGTRAHDWLSDHLLGVRDVVDCDEDEMADHLLAVIDWVEAHPGTRHVEERVDFGAMFGFVDLTGTADLIFDTGDCLHVADLKYGKHVVEVEDNTQLLCYLIGAAQKFGRRENYKLTILQPRAWHRDGPIRTWPVSDETLQEFEDRLHRAIVGSYDATTEPTAGHWCQHYCKAFGRCKAAAKKSLDAFRREPE